MEPGPTPEDVAVIQGGGGGGVNIEPSGEFSLSYPAWVIAFTT